MQTRLSLSYLAAFGLCVGVACSSKDESKMVSASSAQPDAGAPIRALDLAEVSAHPERFTWFDFRPEVKKLILAGAAETEHIAILWYTAADGGVGLHYHAKTESVYVIDGTQTDAKGDYPSGAVYFNPPGSGHQITHSTGFFLLAYAAAPEFSGTERIREYTPVRMDLATEDLSDGYAFTEQSKGVRTHAVPLAAEGGMRAELIELEAGASHTYSGNYLLVLRGACSIAGSTRTAKQLVVTNDTAAYAYKVAAADNGKCVLLAMKFEPGH